MSLLCAKKSEITEAEMINNVESYLDECKRRNIEQIKAQAIKIAENNWNKYGGDWYVVYHNNNIIVTQEPGNREILVSYES